ncbi:universal stress protein [Streptomyces sp. NBC_01267]|uniref:universal stress protein n=1 Tax=Streptomyces sp. NBC_01267 TaxID=2903805 RepID=UPI002E3098CA|nr:universal stress protein [Streptomyces sp. NBC_01267]
MNGSAADSGPTDGTSDARKVPPVVVGTDGSDHATRAVLWAADEAVSQNRPLIIVYAIGGLQPPSLDINGIDVVLRTGRKRWTRRRHAWQGSTRAFASPQC